MSEYELSRRDRNRLVDVGLLVFAIWFSLAQFGSQGWGEYEDVATEPDAPGFFLILLSALPLLWRRQHPWVAMVIAAAAGIALAALGYAVHVPAPLIVALYTFAARPDRGGVWPPIVFTAAAFVAMVMVQAPVMALSIEEYFIPPLLFAGAWIVGERRRTAAIRAAEATEAREREERLSIAEERTRIARELHDSAGHAINTILVQAGAARVLRERDPEGSRAAIAAIELLARETIDDIDRIVGSLREEGPADLEPLPGLDRIADLVDHQRAAGFEVELHEHAAADRPPPAAVGRAAFRIAQEALTNAARHGSGAAELTIAQHPDRLELTVTNPVSGEPPTRPGGGLGIVGMRERAQLLGGTLEADREGDRFGVRAVLPYDRSRE
ncbi:MAG TPA: histidine kinase [Solirubrobacterales bacterium]|nr:histidine kinase [Solirubrobacterales bacterium]